MANTFNRCIGMLKKGSEILETLSPNETTEQDQQTVARQGSNARHLAESIEANPRRLERTLDYTIGMMDSVAAENPELVLANSAVLLVRDCVDDTWQVFERQLTFAMEKLAAKDEELAAKDREIAELRESIAVMEKGREIGENNGSGRDV